MSALAWRRISKKPKNSCGTCDFSLINHRSWTVGLFRRSKIEISRWRPRFPRANCSSCPTVIRINVMRCNRDVIGLHIRRVICTPFVDWSRTYVAHESARLIKRAISMLEVWAPMKTRVAFSPQKVLFFDLVSVPKRRSMPDSRPPSERFSTLLRLCRSVPTSP